MTLNAHDHRMANRICEDHLRAVPGDPDTHRYLRQVLMNLRRARPGVEQPDLRRLLACTYYQLYTEKII